ncbi:MAG: hypothetical protein JW940_18470, partial [Polyangiaceae bacterium]|nr:hypothetical protein [Polyangiaceae bacterium]
PSISSWLRARLSLIRHQGAARARPCHYPFRSAFPTRACEGLGKASGALRLQAHARRSISRIWMLLPCASSLHGHGVAPSVEQRDAQQRPDPRIGEARDTVLLLDESFDAAVASVHPTA